MYLVKINIQQLTLLYGVSCEFKFWYINDTSPHSFNVL